jgi:hypothetical protein
MSASHWAAGDKAHFVCEFQLQCILPLNTKKSLAVYSNATLKISLHCRTYQVLLPTAEPSIKTKPENIEIKPSFI